MSSRGILDADMATLGRYAQEGLRWWVDELATLVPETWRSQRAFSGDFVLYRDDGVIVRYENGSPRSVAIGGADADLAFAAALCLERYIDLPTMNARDLRSYLAVEADRLLPLPAAMLLIDAMYDGRNPGNGTMSIRIGAIRRDLVDAALASAAAAGIVPARVGIVDPEAPVAMRYDFAPQLREEGKLPTRQNRPALWWGAVGFLVLLNVAVFIWQDQQSVVRYEELVASQAPAVSVYRVIADRIARTDQVARATARQRADHDVIGDLARTTEVLPDTAWVQRFEWNGALLRIAGYSRDATDVAGALRRGATFTNIRDTTGDVQADIPIGQPFDISADIVRRRPR